MDQVSAPRSFPMTEPATPRRQPEAPGALAELGDASRNYSAAAAVFISARNDLEDARSRWQHLRDAVAKTTEADGV